jgi:predicted Zn-ribbon and HTH transcriptional regulator
MKSVATCVICGRSLGGRQRRFCSRRCKNADTNNRHQNYAAQKSRGLRRKTELLKRQGARCRSCGYDRNLAALSWHHVDPSGKSFSLDMRSLSNRSDSEIRREAAKCVVLCLNCHAETHYPECAVAIPAGGKPASRPRSR